MPLLERIKSTYLLWFEYYQTIPKLHRHTLGQRIDALFVELIEYTAYASFLPRESEKKAAYLEFAIRKLDTQKVMMLVLWETRSLDTKKYTVLSLKLDEIGKMLGGWYGKMLKENSPDMKLREK